MSGVESARRRFDAMLARAGHQSTPREEALTALEGARRVAGKHDLVGSTRRIEAIEILLGLREPPKREQRSPYAGALEFGEAVEGIRRFAEAMARTSGAFDIVRDADGTYRRRYR